MTARWRAIVMGLAIGVLPLVAVEAAVPATAGTRLARVMAAIGLPSPAPILGVAALQQRVARNPPAWDGRTVRVYGALVSYRTRIDPFTWVTHRLLVDAGARDGSGRLPVLDAPAAPALQWLQQLPLIGRLLAGSQQVRGDRPAVYWVQLGSQTQACCPGHTYDAALLLDTPSDWFLTAPAGYSCPSCSASGP